jgi:hypothetical protein
LKTHEILAFKKQDNSIEKWNDLRRKNHFDLAIFSAPFSALGVFWKELLLEPGNDLEKSLSI